MTFSTLVVCQAGQKVNEIEALIAGNPALALIGSTTMQSAFDKIAEASPSLVWIDLTPDPDEGIKLLVGLKERFPALHCLVSNDELDADLVKISMQVGAIDFLDAGTWRDQLPDVINRLKHKETAAIEAREKQELEKKRIKEALEQQKALHPTTSKTNLSSMKKMVTDKSEIESRAAMNLGLLIVVVALAVGAFFVFGGGGGH